MPLWSLRPATRFAFVASTTRRRYGSTEVPPSPIRLPAWHPRRVSIRVAEVAERVGLGGFPPRTPIFCGDSRRQKPLSRGGPEWPRGMRLRVVREGSPPAPPAYLHVDLLHADCLREEAVEVFGGDFF